MTSFRVDFERRAPKGLSPCSACPWRVENHDKPHPSKWYSKANRRRLWAGGLRNGEPMSCHPTDPNNPVTEADVAAGYRPAPEHAQMRECVGALVLVQREYMTWQEDFKGDLKAYRKERGLLGLTRNGLVALADRVIFGGTPLSGLPKMPTPELSQPGIEVGL